MVASRNRSDSSIRSIEERIRQEYLRKSFYRQTRTIKMYLSFEKLRYALCDSDSLMEEEL